MSPASQDTVDEYVLKAVKLTRTMLTLLPPPVVVIPQYYDDSLQDTNRATWNENKVGPDVKITHYRPVLLYGNHAHVAVKGLVGNYKLESERTSCNTSLPTSASTSKVEDSKSHKKSAILVTSHKPPSPIHALQDTAQTSIRQSKQEIPHCSSYSADYHGEQTPIYYATSRITPTDRDLVNKTHFPKAHSSKVEDPKPHKKSAILVTSHKPPSPIHALQDTAQTSIRQSKQEIPHCSSYSADYHGEQSPIYYATSRITPTDRDLVNKTHTSKVEDLKTHKKSTIPVTSHKPPSPIQDTTTTSIRQSKRETPRCSTYSEDYHRQQTPIYYATSRITPTDRDLVNETHFPKAHSSKVEDPKPHKKSAILVTSHKPPSPIHVLQDTAQTSIRQSKQETPHCSSYSADYHGEQLPTHYTTSRIIPTDRDLVNKTHTSKVEDLKTHKKSAILVTSHKPPSPIQDTTPTSIRQSKRETPRCSPHSAGYYGEQTSIYYATSRITPTDRDLMNKTHFPKAHSNNVEDPKPPKQSAIPNTNVVQIPSPPPGSRRPDFIESGRMKRYRIPSSQSPPSPNKKSPVTKEVLSPPQADNKMNHFLSTPVTKESHSPRVNAVSKERFSNPEPQKRTDPKIISPGTKPLLKADYSKNSSVYTTHTQSLSSTSRSQDKPIKKRINAAVSKDILPDKLPRVNLHSSVKQNQKTSPSRQRQSQLQSINQQQSVINNASQRHQSSTKERTHRMTLRSTSKTRTPPLSPYQKGRIILIV